MTEYAGAALEKSEFELAESVVQSEAGSNKRAAQMIQKIAAGKTDARRKHRRRTWTNTILGSIVFLVLMGGVYIYYDRIGNPKSVFILPDPVFEYRRNLDVIRSNNSRIHAICITWVSPIRNISNRLSGPYSSEMRQLLRKIEKILEAWIKLFDIPGVNDYENVMSIADSLREDMPRIESLAEEYRSFAENTVFTSSISTLKEAVAEIKRFVDDTTTRRAKIKEMENAGTPP